MVWALRASRVEHRSPSPRVYTRKFAFVVSMKLHKHDWLYRARGRTRQDLSDEGWVCVQLGQQQ